MSEPEFIDGTLFIRANLVWDLVKHTEVSPVLEKLGLIPPGPDGQVMACEDSHIRMAYSELVAPQISYLAGEISNVLMTAILINTAEDVDEKTAEELTAQQALFLEAGARVMVAHLIAAQILTYQGLEIL